MYAFLFRIDLSFYCCFLVTVWAAVKPAWIHFGIIHISIDSVVVFHRRDVTTGCCIRADMNFFRDCIHNVCSHELTSLSSYSTGGRKNLPCEATADRILCLL
jgi:hypothetical protein